MQFKKTVPVWYQPRHGRKLNTYYTIKLAATYHSSIQMASPFKIVWYYYALFLDLDTKIGLD